jgi:hypothetical protein
MKRSRFTEWWGTVAPVAPRKPGQEIIGMLKEQEAGLSTAEICRKHGVSQGGAVFGRTTRTNAKNPALDFRA